MAQQFDFDNIGKRLPYTMPKDTFDVMQANVFAALEKDRKAKLLRRIVRRGSIAGIAAAVAILIAVREPVTASDEPLEQIDLAYSNLSDAEQEYLIEIYREDLFLNQE